MELQFKEVERPTKRRCEMRHGSNTEITGNTKKSSAPVPIPFLTVTVTFGCDNGPNERARNTWQRVSLR